MRTLRITKWQLKEASRNVRDKMLEAIAEQENVTHRFSPEFEKKMEILFRRNKINKARKQRLKYIAAGLAVAVIGISGIIIARQGAVAGFKPWNVTNMNEDSVLIHYYATQSDGELPDYTFGWLPDGYDVDESITFANPKLVAARNQAGNEILLVYQFMNEKTDLVIGSEGMGLKQETIQMNDHEALFFYDDKKATSNLLTWTDDKLLFYVQAKLPKETLLEIAKGIIEK